MKFLMYEDVPLFLGPASKVDGNEGDFIFAADASISISQPSVPRRSIDDNKIRICQFNNGGTYPFASPNFTASSSHTACFGPTSGPPKSLSTSIYKIPKDTKITFPGGKHLYFDHDVFPNGYDYLARLRSESGGWQLSESEAQSGYFEPIFNYAAGGPAAGTLDVTFYTNTGNLPSFFNVTGMSSPTQFPPIDEDKITGHLGDFKFSDAYLKSFKFSVSPNSIVAASASFDIYGALVKDETLSQNYYSTGLYQQKSIAHGETSTIIGTTKLGVDHAVSFSYGIDVERSARYEIGNSIPTRVSKRATTITMSINGNNLDPSLITDAVDNRRANINIYLRDLNYDNFDENSNGLLNVFNCSGVVESQNLSVSSNGYLNGSISIKQHLK